LTNSLETKIAGCCAGKRILITGGGGYLAHGVLRRLVEIDCRVIRFGRSAEKMTTLAGCGRVEQIIGDVRDREIWASLLEGVDLVFHFAAQTSVYTAQQDPLADLQANVLPLLHLLETCRLQSWRPIVVFAGTVTEVGLPATMPVDESPTDRPITIYDLHKLTAERYLAHYAKEGCVRGATLRLANVYGPGPRSSSADRGVLNMMVRRALAGEAITVYGDGQQVRDYVYIEDVADAFLACAAEIDHTNGRYFVIGSGEGHTILEAMNTVCERVALKTGARAPLIHVEPPAPQSPIEARNFVADCSLFTRLTGWRPRVNLIEGIDRTIESVA
jgi:nucleoside-diphosphate-sugar epimerase